MSCIANQIVPVCALLVNFQPVLIPLSTLEESDVDGYLSCYYESNSDETDSYSAHCLVHFIHYYYSDETDSD